MVVSGGVNRNSPWARRGADLSRAMAQPLEIEPINSQLMKVTDRSTVSAGQFRYLYTVRRAQVGTSAGGYVPDLTANTLAESALSVSELSNAGTTVSYGVVKSTLPAGFEPKPIPVGTYVMCVPHRLTDGTLIWLIINTQAIDGVCS